MNDIILTPPPIAVAVTRLAHHDPALALPAYETTGAAGLDLRACLPVDLRVSGQTLEPGARALIPTGLSVAIPQGYEIQVRPRSGLALKAGVTLANAPGTIDSDYRGEVGVILINLGQAAHLISHGDRIAQAVLARVARLEWEEAEALPPTTRGAGGFGSTGGV